MQQQIKNFSGTYGRTQSNPANINLSFARQMHLVITALIAILLLVGGIGPARADPPALVGRISFISGEASFRAERDEEWEPAVLNYPVASHNAFATSDDSRLEIRVGAAAIRLDDNSEISIPRIGDDLIRVNVKFGVTNISVHSRESQYPVEVLTPAGKVTLNSVGVYRFEVTRDYEQVIIAALQGGASLHADNDRITVKSGSELVVDRIDPLEYSVRYVRRHGAFEDWLHARDERIRRSVSARYLSPEIAGYEDLDEYGEWRQTTEYGPVWTPQVAYGDWEPHRQGSWAWTASWGWTWVDHAAWGFAPFHYGKWIYLQGRWCWAPGRAIARAVYAPALITAPRVPTPARRIIAAEPPHGQRMGTVVTVQPPAPPAVYTIAPPTYSRRHPHRNENVHNAPHYEHHRPPPQQTQRSDWRPRQQDESPGARRQHPHSFSQSPSRSERRIEERVMHGPATDQGTHASRRYRAE